MIKSILWLIIAAALFIGEILCIYKAINCNWKPVGKAEIVYTVGIFTGLGGIVGYMNIADD